MVWDLNIFHRFQKKDVSSILVVIFELAILTLSLRVAHQHMVKDLNLRIKSLSTYYREKNSSRFATNSEENASELLENLKEMFPRY